jgi:hypothetical protein
VRRPAIQSADVWRMWQGVAGAVLVALGLAIAGIPFADPCRFCDAHQFPWYWCWLGGCF